MVHVVTIDGQHILVPRGTLWTFDETFLHIFEGPPHDVPIASVVMPKVLSVEIQKEP